MKIEYPSIIQIETTNRCNARCSFCPVHRAKSRPDMSDGLFQKVVQDAKEINPEFVCPFLNGEMFLDEKIFERMKYINQELPNTHLDIFTNASLLNERKIEELSAIKNINIIHCSLNASNADEYKETVGLNFQITCRNIKDLIELNSKKQFAKEIKVLCVEKGKEFKDNIEHNDNFVKFVREEIGGIPQVSYKYNYIGQIYSKRPIKNVRCPKLDSLCILSDGLVALCCMDVNGDYILGDASKQSLLEIFNGDIARKYRFEKRQKLIPCNRCNVV